MGKKDKVLKRRKIGKIKMRKIYKEEEERKDNERGGQRDMNTTKVVNRHQRVTNMQH